MKANNYKVSEQTAMYLEAMKQADVFYTSVSDACYKHFGDGQADNAMQEFNDRYSQMMAEVRNLFVASVVENMAEVNSTQI